MGQQLNKVLDIKKSDFEKATKIIIVKQSPQRQSMQMYVREKCIINKSIPDQQTKCQIAKVMQNIKFLKLKNLEIDGSHEIQLKNLNAPLLQSLEIRNFKDISPQLPPDFNFLRILNIQRVPIKVLPKIKAPLMHQIILIQTQLCDFCDSFIEQHPNLKRLTLINTKKLKTLKAIKSSKLQMLNVYYNSILQSVEQFAKQRYCELNELIFEFNSISEIPVLNMPKITRINISGNVITSLEQFAKGAYFTLTYLNISKNQITKIPYIGAPNLIQAIFSFNLIKQIDQFAFGKYQRLTIFEIGTNKLEKMSMVNAPSLKKLDLQGNCMRQIKFQKQAELGNLEYISLFKNMLSNPPIFLCSQEFLHLKYLYLNKNNIISIQALGQTDLNTVEKLDLSVNYITKLQVFKRLKMSQLFSLNLSRNMIFECQAIMRSKIYANFEQNKSHSITLYLESDEKTSYNSVVINNIFYGNINWIFKLQNSSNILQNQIQFGKKQSSISLLPQHGDHQALSLNLHFIEKNKWRISKSYNEVFFRKWKKRNFEVQDNGFIHRYI